MLGWRFLAQVVGGGILFYEGVGMTQPFKPFSQCMVNRGVVLFVSACAVLSACAVVALVVVAFVFARVVVGVSAGVERFAC